MERRTDRAGRYLFYVIYLLFIIYRLFLSLTRIPDLLGDKTVDFLSHGILVIIIALAAIKLLFLKRQTVKSLSVSLIVLAVFFISAMVSTSRTMFYSVLIALCASREELDRDIRFSLRCVVAVTVVTVLLCGTGLIDNFATTREISGAKRYSLGFTHPNSLALVIFLIIAEYLYIHRKNNQYWRFFLTFGLAAAGYLITHSFTGAFLSIILIGTAFVIAVKEKNRRIPRRWMKALVILLILAICLITFYYWNNPDQLTQIFKTVRSRIKLAQKYIEAYGINFFGNAIEVGEGVSIPGYKNTYGYLDSGYIRILVEFGIITFVMFFGLYLLSVFREIRRRNNLLAAYGIIYLLYGLLEFKALTFVFNPFLIVYLNSCFEARRAMGPKAS